MDPIRSACLPVDHEPLSHIPVVCSPPFRGVGDIVLIYKRVTNLASHTGRVSELLEQVWNTTSWECMRLV